MIKKLEELLDKSKDSNINFENFIKKEMVASGIFSSLTQARRNGFAMDIPEGFSDRFIGKLKKRITILNIKN